MPTPPITTSPAEPTDIGNELLQRRRMVVDKSYLLLPLYVNVRSLDQDQVSGLMDRLTHTFGAQYFREKELTLEVLADEYKAAANPRAFLYGPYLKVCVTSNDVLRITTAPSVSNDEGGAVYALDQITHMLDVLDERTQSETEPAQRPRQRM